MMLHVARGMEFTEKLNVQRFYKKIARHFIYKYICTAMHLLHSPSMLHCNDVEAMDLSEVNHLLNEFLHTAADNNVVLIFKAACWHSPNNSKSKTCLVPSHFVPFDSGISCLHANSIKKKDLCLKNFLYIKILISKRLSLNAKTINFNTGDSQRHLYCLRLPKFLMLFGQAEVLY